MPIATHTLIDVAEAKSRLRQVQLLNDDLVTADDAYVVEITPGKFFAVLTLLLNGYELNADRTYLRLVKTNKATAFNWQGPILP